jgi:hypothetical protein
VSLCLARFWHLDVYLAGCVAGFAQVLLGCPIDIIKIKLQYQTGEPAIQPLWLAICACNCFRTQMLNPLTT